jgi:hypothetical protein
MTHRLSALVGLLIVAGVALPNVILHAAAISKQEADLFARKVAQIVGQADRNEKPGSRRTSVSESELNSWFAYSATPLLPAGVAEPRITMVGNGKVAGKAIVDLDVIAKRKQSGGTFDLWNLVGGKVPSTSSALCGPKMARALSFWRVPTFPVCPCRRPSCRRSSATTRVRLTIREA